MDKRDSDLAFMQEYFQKVVNSLWLKNEFVGVSPNFYWQIPKNINQAQATRDKDLVPLLKESKLRFNKKYFLDTYNIAQTHLEEFVPDAVVAKPTGNLSLQLLARGNSQDAGELIEAQQLSKNIQPMDPERLVEIVKKAASVEELETRLKEELKDPANVADFAHAMREARLVASMMGYLTIAKRNK
jgi:hypothetical protein